MSVQYHQKVSERKSHRRQKKIRKIRSLCFQIIYIIVVGFLAFYICFYIWKISKLLFIEPETNNENPVDIEDQETTTKKLSNSNMDDDSSDDSWCLRLVNSQNALPEDYSMELTQLINNQSIDSRCYPDLQEMMDDCRSAGLNPLICSSYRTAAKQKSLFTEKVDEYLLQGYSQDEAEEKAASSVAPVGYSEHQLGLALDIVDTSYQQLNKKQEDTPVQHWLMNNSWKYGFILRYPEGKSDITGIIYEPWHYRYVGKTAAKEIYEQELCLEEYLENH